MKKIIGLVVAVSLFAPFAAFADSNITASANGASSISPAGTVFVATGNVQSFNISNATSVSVDGVEQGGISSYDFTGDLSDHTIVAVGNPGGGSLLYCSGPLAPGWTVGLPNGGCGAPKAPVYLPTYTVQNADGSYTFGIVR